MLHRTIRKITRLAFTSGVMLASLDAAVQEADAQIVRPAIGRFHDGRTDPANAFNIEHRYLDRQSTTRFRERQTHLGWEVRGESFVVFANSSLNDARLAAQVVESTWSDTLRMAEYFTDRHHQPNFSVAAIAVHVDSNPRREREDGLLRFTNDKTHIYLNVADGETELASQLGELRASTVHAFWWRSEFQRQVPEWVRSGVASYIATQQAIASGETSDTTPIDVNVYDPYWQRGRIAPDQLAARETTPTEAAIRVRYLLEGDDARHAPAFFAALRGATGQAPPAERFGNVRLLEPNNQIIYSSNVDDLFARVDEGMSQWLSDPMVDQPIVEPLEGALEVTSVQTRMAFVLKLLQRLDEPARRRVTPRIIGADGTHFTATTPLKPYSLSNLQHRLTRPDAPLLATLDPQGNLLLSDQTERMQELLRPHDGGSYRSLIHDDRRAIETWIGFNTKLIAWLEENEDEPRRPLVKFERVVADGVIRKPAGTR